MLFELVNPSDEYTLETESFRAAAVAAMVIGLGGYGLRQLDGDLEMPIFLVGGAEEWAQKQFSIGVEELIRSTDKLQIAACLNSFVIGGEAEREAYFEQLGDKDGDAADWFWEQWQDTYLTSATDIGRIARAHARGIYEEFGPKAEGDDDG